MTKKLDSRKYRLIQEILKLDNEQDVTKMEQQVQSIKQLTDIQAAIKPIRKSLAIEQMIEEQNYTPIKREEFFKKAEQLQIEEPLEKLLADLT